MSLREGSLYFEVKNGRTRARRSMVNTFPSKYNDGRQHQVGLYISSARGMIFSLAKKIAHCKEIWIYVFPEKKLRVVRPNFHIHVSVSDLYIFLYFLVWSPYLSAAE